MTDSFRAFASQPFSYTQYDRSVPLKVDTLQWDTTGGFDLANHCFVAPYDCTVDFTVNLLWQAPPDKSNISTLMFLNTLPPPGGDNTGEIMGADVTIMQPFAAQGSLYNLSGLLNGMLKLKQGDKVWAVPCINATKGTLCPTQTGHINFFQGVVVSKP